MSFIHLHLHSQYSLLDGACRIVPLIDAVRASGENAVAITDHGVMYNVWGC
jgi:DNA polymerase-3 subunit alpha